MIEVSWISFVIILGVKFIFSLVRASFANLHEHRLMVLADQSPGDVEATINLLNKSRLRVTFQLGSLVLNLLLTGVTWMLLEAYALLPTIFAIRLVILFGIAFLIQWLEFQIEGNLLSSPEIWALRLTPIARIIDWIFSPFSFLLMKLNRSLTRSYHSSSAVTDDELRSWVATDQPESKLEPEERKMIYSIFQFGEKLCREIMVPRMDVRALDINSRLDEAVQMIAQSGHSRVPVYEDTIDNIIGLLYAKDLLQVKCTEGSLQSIRNLLRPVYYVPEVKKVEDLLHEMQENRVHMAIIVEEYGGVVGIVTMEDIVEEIVGEIRDEYDQKEEIAIQRISDDEVILQGRLDLDRVNEELSVHLKRESEDTLAGFVYRYFGRVPSEGEEIPVEGWIFIVEKVSGRRILKIRARRKSSEDEEDNI